MANAREIQDRMHSIQDTLKITNAMYLISSTKLRKARTALEATEPYFYTLRGMLDKILSHIPEVRNQYFDPHIKKAPEERTRGFVVIAADKGLAGAFNHNVLKMAKERIEDPAWKGKCKLFVVGELARQFFLSQGIEIDGQFHYTSQSPTLHRARIISLTVLEQFEKWELDEVYIIYTRSLNSMSMEPEIVQLLPLKDREKNREVLRDELEMRPDPQSLVDHLVPDICRGYVYGTLVESYCSEQNARMMAMEAAGKNAKEMIHDLSIQYNRIRQAMITQEITEVIAGAKAQKKKKEKTQKQREQRKASG
jgi:F-type H+-transporting ATPase subunit gamma